MILRSWCPTCGAMMVGGKCKRCHKVERRRRVWRAVLGGAVGGLGLFMMVLGALAQQPVITQPFLVYSSNASSTIAVTDTFQTIFLAPAGRQQRSGCTIVNYGTHTMWVYFGAATDTPAKAKSVQLAANQPVTCNNNGITLQDQVSITGTGSDAYFAAQQ